MNRDELLWKYAEDKCNSDEKASVEKWLVEQPELKQELDFISEINTSLSEMETSGPSMRFSKNVMEALPPNLYPPITTPSLIGPFWKKTFGSSLAALTLWAIASVFLDGMSGTVLPYTDQVIATVNKWAGALPPVAAQFMGLTLASLLTLALIDKLFFSKVNE